LITEYRTRTVPDHLITCQTDNFFFPLSLSLIIYKTFSLIKFNFIMRTIKILATNAARERGRKVPVEKLILEPDGVADDVHAGSVRPVSMFDVAHAKRFYDITGARPLAPGQFAENILFETSTATDVRIFDHFIKDEVVLEVVQKGKPFHDEFREPGNYVMPREGIFCRVVRGGELHPGDVMQHTPRVFKALVITLSDRASRGIYTDKSGPAVSAILQEYFEKIDWRLEIENLVIPDSEIQLRKIVEEALPHTDLIITTGGTGIGPRDITPEIMNDFIKKPIPGIMEMIRWKYGVEKPAALTSRAVAGANGDTLLFAIPGSLRAATEHITEITKHLQHLFYMIHSIEMH
jgi:molybdenum cofactor synthesis domain-containing protein